MQGKSKYKTRCGKFKRLGDGIQTDAIADDGYTWDFYFRNEPSDPALLAQGYCPMHCRLLHMFSNLREIFLILLSSLVPLTRCPSLFLFTVY
jgi:hypothetical protein